MLPRLIDGAPFSAYTRGTSEAAATFAAQGTGRQAWITDIAGSANISNAELYVESDTRVLFNISLGSPNSIPFSHQFLSPLRASVNEAVRVRVGTTGATASWAFIGGYWVQN